MKCPVTGCTRHLQASFHLCCTHHWFRIPKAVRDRIWELYQREEGSEAHRSACLEALAQLNEQALAKA